MQKLLIKLFLISFFLLIIVNFFRPITAINEDLGRHLLLGRIILETKSVPHINLLSYTNYDAPFINSHWGAEIIFYFIQHIAGFDGLIIFSTFIAILSIAIIFFFVRKNFHPIPLILATVLYLLLLFERTDIRPEMFSYLFLSIFVVTLYRYRSYFSKKIFLLIPLQILWVNIHIYFFVGLIILFLFLIDQLIASKLRLKKPTKILLLTFFLACIGTLINPNGIYGAIFPLTVFQNYVIQVVENQNIFTLLTVYRQPTIFCFLGVMSMLFILLILNFRKTRPIDWLLSLTFSLVTLFAFRNLSLFVYATFIPFVTALSPFITHGIAYTKKFVGEKYFVILKNYFFIILLLLLFVQFAQIFSTKPPGLGINDYGKSVSNFFIKNNIDGPIYNSFDIGSYLSYRLYPQKIFIDGRPEAYPKDFIEKIYLPMQENSNLFGQIDKLYSFNALVISHWDQTPYENKLLKNFMQNQTYQLIYLDDYAVILVKNNAKNKKLIDQFAITQEIFPLPNDMSAETAIRYLYFFEKVGWNDKKNELYKKLQKIDPESKIVNQYRSGLQK